MSNPYERGATGAPTFSAGYFSDFQDVERHLEQLGLFRMVPGLERMEAMLDRLRLKRPPFRVVQVVGTNGKGSTSTMLASLTKEHGIRAGIHTSPHFVSVRERVKIDGEPLSEEQWTHLGNTLIASGGEELSYFEFVTCLAVLAFAVAGVSMAVMETGLGGRYDATTALDADMVIFTPIDLDHQTVLGASLSDIAQDKAAAIRNGCKVVTARQKPAAIKAIEQAAHDKDADLYFLENFPVSRDLLPAELALEGPHQADNALLALCSWRLLQTDAENEAGKGRLSVQTLTPEEQTGLAKAWLPGRLQAVPPVSAECLRNATRRPEDLFSPSSLGWPPMILDGAHNAHGMEALGLALAKRGIAPAAVIFSCLEDKELEKIVPLVRALATGPIFVPPIADNPRAAPPEKLAALIGLNATPVSSLKEAISMASRHMEERLPEVFEGKCPKNPLLLCGSLYLLGEFYTLRPDCLESPIA